ncbi:two-component system OmpR family sensor kinase [Kutzneria buriramensis]|uniref:histidine kinase n=1 Tax=Kutzneria buriramensis TaxID=1045776 RepID=A0A3E0GTH3_9PSEU|nr:two-component system OmpR family sensor kinase [Kutzneria buriramensis]
MRRRGRSLRAKLVVSFVWVTVAGLVAVQVMTVVAGHQALLDKLSRGVESSRTLMVAYLDKVSESPQARPDSHNSAGNECATLLISPDGQLVRYYADNENGAHDVPTPALAQLRDMADSGRAQMLGGNSFIGAAGRLATGEYVVVAAPVIGYLQLWQDFSTMEGIVALVVLGVLILTILTITRRALRPLHSITVAAEHIAEGSLSQRVDEDESSAEFASLARSFNTMLQRLQDSFTRRREAEQRLREFVAAASHELRTPLTAISGYAQLALLGALDDPVEFRQAMRRVSSESDRMTSLVQEMLLLAELDQGRPLEYEVVDLALLCQNAVHDARAADHGRELTYSEANGPHLVGGDCQRLHQVVANLLANIRAHTPTGTPAQVRLCGEDGLHFIDIVDDGPGIPPEQRELVFERFFRGDRSRHDEHTKERSGMGSGLGLSIVAAIVHAHNGSVRVLPCIRGAWFRVALPALPADRFTDLASAEPGKRP